jgi:hypothetical protein
MAALLIHPAGMTRAETGEGQNNAVKQPAIISVPKRPGPLVRDFVGINGHTVMFKPELYRPVGQLVRDDHGLDWRIGKETTDAPRFSLSRNNVNWETLYGSWKKAGYDTGVCVMLGQNPPASWKDMPRDAFAYGLSFARFFGPSGTQPLANSIEIGNEPGNCPDRAYRTLFENRARGIRQGDPKLKSVTCAAVPGTSEAYAKSLSCMEEWEPLYDVINLHTYAFAKRYPTWLGDP